MITQAYPPAVVFGLSPTGLAVIRSLGRKGIEVWGIDRDRYRSGFFSKYCKKLAIADPESGEAQLVERLLEFGSRSSGKPVLFATDDDYLDFIAKHSLELQPYFTFPRLDPSMLDQFLNKRAFSDLCAHHGVPTPGTYTIQSEGDLESVSLRTRYPAIIKPIYTHVWARRYPLRKAFVVRSSSELKQVYHELGEMKANILVQEIIAGKEDQIYIFAAYFSRESEPLRIFTGRKIRQYPLGFGTTTAAESLWVPEVADLSVRFLKQIRFQGLCDVEFKKDPADHQFKMIEINPRAGRWYSLTDAAGADIIYTAYLDLIGEPVEKKAEFRDHVKWLFLFRDVPTVLQHAFSGSISFREWLTSLKGTREHALFSVEDPLPSITYLLEILSRSFAGVWSKARIHNSTNVHFPAGADATQTPTGQKPQ